jgi:hypothetical protein
VVARLYASDERGRRNPLRLAVALAAGALLWWIARHPSRSIIDFFTRWDHVAFCALAGGALAGATPTIRLWALGLVNVVVMGQYFGATASLVILSTIAVAYVTLGLRGARSALALASLGVIIYAACWYLRATSVGQAAQTFGLFSIVFLRQISAAVAHTDTPRPPFGGYLCYLTYYLGSFGPVSGPEVYADFSRRNFAQLHHDPVGAARRIAWGALQIWMAHRIPADIADLQQAASTVAIWQISLLLFVRTALFGMGLWAITDGLAIFHGFRRRGRRPGPSRLSRSRSRSGTRPPWRASPRCSAAWRCSGPAS